MISAKLVQAKLVHGIGATSLHAEYEPLPGSVLSVQGEGECIVKDIKILGCTHYEITVIWADESKERTYRFWTP